MFVVSESFAAPLRRPRRTHARQPRRLPRIAIVEMVVMTNLGLLTNARYVPGVGARTFRSSASRLFKQLFLQAASDL